MANGSPTAGVAWLSLPQACRLTWGDNSLNSLAAVGITVEAKVPALVVRVHCLWHPPYLERAQGVLNGPGTPLG